jgi:hypothetical protein
MPVDNIDLHWFTFGDAGLTAISLVWFKFLAMEPIEGLWT